MKYDVIVIGAGIMGTSSAYAMSRKGLKVLVIDPLSLKNRQNASNDVSRMFRTYQGKDVLKTEMAERSEVLWKDIAKQYPRRNIFQRSSLLVLDPGNEEYPLSLKGISMLSRAGLAMHFPSFRSESAIVESTAAIINASDALLATAKAAKTVGAQFLHGQAVQSLRNGTVTLCSGAVFQAGQVVVACGSWTDALLQYPVGVKATQQEVAFFRPKNLQKFRVGNFPLFAHLPTWFYGFPDNGVGAVKVARHILGPEMDPKEKTREASRKFISDCRDFFSDVIPILADAELVRSRTSRYAVRPNEEFLIDRIDSHTIIATAFRGEGFKFAPIVGELVNLLAHGHSLHPKFKRFRL